MARKKIYDIRPPSKKPPVPFKEKSSGLKSPNLELGLGPGVFRKLFPARLFSAMNIGIFVSVLLIGGFLYLHFTASAEIRVYPAVNDISFKKEAAARTDIVEPDFENAVIKAQLLTREKEVSGSFPATGMSETATKARGRVTVINEYHSDQVLVEKTRFLSADSKLFYSQERIVVPAGGSYEVAVEAAEAGPDYNIKPATFSVPGLLGSPRYTSVYAESQEAMQGGTIGETAVVTEEDISEAEDSLKEKSRAELQQDFLELSGASFEVLPDTVEVEVIEAQASVEVGTAVDSFEVSLTIKGQGLAFHREEAAELARQWIREKTEEAESLREDSVVVDVASIGSDTRSGEAELRIEAGAELVREVDTEDLKRRLMGKTIKETRTLLSSYTQVEKIEVQIYPFWVSRIPNDPTSVRLELIFE